MAGRFFKSSTPGAEDFAQPKPEVFLQTASQIELLSPEDLVSDGLFLTGDGIAKELTASTDLALAKPAPADIANDTQRGGVARSGIVYTKDLIEYEVALHGFLIDRINLAVIDKMDKPELEKLLAPLVREFIRQSRLVLTRDEISQLTSSVSNELKGLGPLEPLLADPTISDILVNGPHEIYIERKGILERTPIRFKDEDHLMRIINKIVSAIGRRVDEASPLVDARLLDGSRVNVAVRPVSLDGPALSIRKFSEKKLSLFQLIENGALTHEMAVFLAISVAGRVSLLVSGGTGSGKTTLLNALSNAIPSRERLITIEDAAELKLQKPHVVRMETRPKTVEGQYEIRQGDLVRNALRMRPDRIIVGEVRGEEAYDMIQAMNTGHEGSLSTIHANTPRDALGRLEQMISMRSQQLTALSIRRQIVSSLQLIVQAQRFSDGTRRIVSISEVTGMEGDVIQTQEVYGFVQKGVDANGKVLGKFSSSGNRPRVLAKLALAGLTMQTGLNTLVDR